MGNILKQAHHTYSLTEYWFWRDHHQHEIDLLSRVGGRFQTYEIKQTQTILPRLFRGLNHFESEVVRQPTEKTLIYGGDQPHDRTGVQVRTWWGGEAP